MRISTPEPDSSTVDFLGEVALGAAGLMASMATTVGDTLVATSSKRLPSWIRGSLAGAEGGGLASASTGVGDRPTSTTASTPPRNEQQPRNRTMAMRRIAISLLFADRRKDLSSATIIPTSKRNSAEKVSPTA